MTTENALMNLCDHHYTCTRRVVTSVALPPGAIHELRNEMNARAPERIGSQFRYGAICLMSRSGELVALEELEGITEPTVLSDREWRPQ